MLNPASRPKVIAGLDAILVFGSKRMFPSGSSERVDSHNNVLNTAALGDTRFINAADAPDACLESGEPKADCKNPSYG